MTSHWFHLYNALNPKYWVLQEQNQDTEQNMKFSFSFQWKSVYKILLLKMHGILLIWAQFTMKTSTVIQGLLHLLWRTRCSPDSSHNLFFFTPYFPLPLPHYSFPRKHLKNVPHLNILVPCYYILHTSLNTVFFLYWCWQFKWDRVLFPMHPTASVLGLS